LTFRWVRGRVTIACVCDEVLDPQSAGVPIVLVRAICVQ